MAENKGDFDRGSAEHDPGGYEEDGEEEDVPYPGVAREEGNDVPEPSSGWDELGRVNHIPISSYSDEACVARQYEYCTSKWG